MTLSKSSAADNPNSLVEAFDQLRLFIARAVKDGLSLKEAEQTILAAVMTIGKSAVSLFLSQQGDGDLGQSIDTAVGPMTRSDTPRERKVRTLFGEHSYSAYVYGRSPDKKIEYRPIDARIELPEGKFSPKFQEIAHMLFSEQAFERAAATMKAIFGSKISVNSLERISQTLGPTADDFLFQVPVPAAKDEGEILVLSADGKGVPMIREAIEKTAAFEKRSYPGNRKMATLATVYSVDHFVRTPEEIVDALFRENQDEPQPKRPEPAGKIVVGHMTWTEAGETPLSGAALSFAWAKEQITRRRQPGQPLVRLMDGQPSLWEASEVCFEDDDHDQDAMPPIDILDIIHVSSYVWTAAKIFHSHREHQEAFTRDRLMRILRGDVCGVIAGLRQMATKRELSKGERAVIDRVCGYFENNRERMRYASYLRSGYPIATGVIEGACRHLVMDRMCRTGMRWGVTGSQAMLNVRAVYQSELTEAFHNYRADRHREKTAKFRPLLKDYKPHALCG